MLDLVNFEDKCGRSEALRFIKWCILNKELTQRLFEPNYTMSRSELEETIMSLERHGLYSVSITYQLIKFNRKDVMEKILETDIEKIDNLNDDYLPVGISDFLNCPKAAFDDFKILWDKMLEENNPNKPKNRTFDSWIEQEWYDWEYICNTLLPEPDIIEELYQKISTYAINTPSFNIVKAFMQERFYVFDGDNWVIKPYILACKEIYKHHKGKVNEKSE